MMSDSTILIKLSGNAPNLLLATSANKAVAVHDKATDKDKISPKYCMTGFFAAQK